ncbi:MAG TPA: hypothetical protein VH114_00950 [Candidatus Acidoferrum sp.]|nr:hypothetical protein [Candidatus Acidoferrum sp.]
MKSVLDVAASGQSIDDNLAQQLVSEGQSLINEVSAAASGATSGPNQQ